MGDASSGDSRKYILYVVFVLFLINVVNYLDRTIIAILVEPIKRDLRLNDTQIGLLTGFAFAAVYAIASIPLGWLADKASRKTILGASIALWSIMTAACGLASSFSAFFLLRMGMGIGEAGGVPTTFSLTADYVPPEKRSSAFGFIALGPNVGLAAGLLFGGLASKALGWRGALMLAGVPGLVLAILVALTVREPMRGRSDRVGIAANSESLGATLRALLTRPSLVQVIAGGSISAVGNGVLVWLPAFFARVHGFDTVKIALQLVVFQSLGALIGTLGGGWLCDRLYSRDERWQMRFAGWTTLLSAPAFAASFLTADPLWSLIFLTPAFALRFACLGPYYAMLQNLAGPTRRSMVSALSMFAITLLGSGLGPFLIGASSDLLAAAHRPDPLRWALCTTLPFLVWGGLHFLWANRGLRHDLRAANEISTTSSEVAIP